MQLHFYELLSTHVLSPKDELRNLCQLFSDERFFPSKGFKQSLEEIVNDRVFRHLSFRGTFVDTIGMRKALGISEEDFFLYPEVPLEKLFLFSEFLMGIIIEGERLLYGENAFLGQMTTILSNIKEIVARTNHALRDISNPGELPRYIIVEESKLASQAVELIENPAVSLSAIEYNHYALQGNLNRKQTILNTLANYVEPILKSNVLKHNGFAQLQSDAGFVLNNFHIRHNNKDGANRKDYIASISDGDLEKWYDKAYNILLSVIVEQENVATHSELETLKSTYSWN